MTEDVQCYLVDGRPVKWKPAIAGGSVTLVWDEAAGQFIADLSLVDRLLLPDDQVTSVDRPTFDRALAARRQPASRRCPHPARAPVIDALLAWADSLEPIDDVLRGLTESGMHWFILGHHAVDGRVMAVVVESASLGVACIGGDGALFGAVHVPDAPTVRAIAERYGLQPF
jgi:hypothetical protein